MDEKKGTTKEKTCNGKRAKQVRRRQELDKGNAGEKHSQNCLLRGNRPHLVNLISSSRRRDHQTRPGSQKKIESGKTAASERTKLADKVPEKEKPTTKEPTVSKSKEKGKT